jgi:hypothetical protein
MAVISMDLSSSGRQEVSAKALATNGCLIYYLGSSSNTTIINPRIPSYRMVESLIGIIVMSAPTAG